jgi:hypothetical protein
LALLIVTVLAGAKSTSLNPYPNELRGFKFYAKYLAPLRPGVSSEEAGRRVLGDSAAVQRNSWTIIPTYTAESNNPTLSPLFEIIVRPDGEAGLPEKLVPVLRAPRLRNQGAAGDRQSGRQRAMGHGSPATAMKYQHPELEQVRRVLNGTNIRNQPQQELNGTFYGTVTKQ